MTGSSGWHKGPLVDAHCTLGVGRYSRLSADELLFQMDKYGVDRAVISSPDRYLAVANREGDDAIIAACHAHSDRFIGFAGINPWYGDAAALELRRSVEEGLRGLVLHPPLQGFMLLDDVVDSLLQVASELQVPAYVHTGTPYSSLPLQLMALARRFPLVTFIMGRMGHSDFWRDAIPAALGAPNIVAEISYKQPAVIRDAVERLGAGRVVFGSDTPYNDLGLEVVKLRAAELAEPAVSAVAGGTLLRILGLRRDPTEGRLIDY